MLKQSPMYIEKNEIQVYWTGILLTLPTGLNAGKFYGTAKVHKLKHVDTVDKLPLQPTVSNYWTASYKLAKYLAKLLSLLSKSQYTVQTAKEFINHVKEQKAPLNYKMISFPNRLHNLYYLETYLWTKRN